MDDKRFISLIIIPIVVANSISLQLFNSEPDVIHEMDMMADFKETPAVPAQPWCPESSLENVRLRGTHDCRL